jgi:hypothetical protein
MRSSTQVKYTPPVPSEQERGLCWLLGEVQTGLRTRLSLFHCEKQFEVINNSKKKK